jgi:aspartyl-tRNA(Asn)/glutamyl-tRNA(Gln) amidotransferase subunit A
VRHAQPGATAREQAAAVRDGRTDPVALVEQALARLAACDDDLRAFVAVDADGARAQARALRDGPVRGPLHGVPVAVKDLFDVAGQATRAGSELPPGPPAQADAEAVARLRAAGAVVLGRTRTHEFAWGITTQHPRLGGAHNPHDLARVPGGSSGGSAVAVAAGVVALALGTDTGCSIRLPAAWCGLVGHKPTWGTVPLTGVVPLAPSLDCGGALVRDVADARLAHEVLSGAALPAPATVAGLRLGVVRGPVARAVAARLEETVERAVSAGLRPQEAALPGSDLQQVYGLVQGVEALAWHTSTGRWPAHADEYGDDVRALLELCEGRTAAELEQAAADRARLRSAFAALFEQVDVLLAPVAACGPSRTDDPATGVLDGLPGPLRAAVLPWTVPANLAGLPACAVPVGVDDDGLPVGLQVIGPPGADARVLDVAAALTA